jgi:hypothetical protein
MKKIFLTLLLSSIICLNINAQKVGKVTITTKTDIATALAQCKEAGKEEKYGSRDFEDNKTNGKLTLWQTIGRSNPSDFYCQITATFKDSVTTLVLRIPHNAKVIANYPHELKKIVKHLKLPEMLKGEYTDEIE